MSFYDNSSTSYYLNGTIGPRSYAESWDNVGLMVGDRNAIVTGVLTTLDVTAGGHFICH